MYLADRDILAILAELDIQTDGLSVPFDVETQVQPASIDLRLDAVVWKQRSRAELDLRRAKLLELSPRRQWTRERLGPGETIVLKPGDMLLGRTHEIFTIPRTCAGKLEGRSSFARLGLAVHCSGDFINPGWRGQMPLELVNHGRSAIRLVPYIPICQLVLVRLSAEPSRTYGDRELASKYMDDDGGPSYWWRDKRIEELHRALGERDVVERVQTEILQVIGPREPELIERFETLVRRLRHHELTNAGELLDRFAREEDDARFRARVVRSVLRGAGPLLLAGSLSSIFSQPIGILHYLLWLATVLGCFVSFFAWRQGEGQYFGKHELSEARSTSSVR